MLGRQPPTLTEEELRGRPFEEQVMAVIRRAGEAGLRADGSGTERLLRDRIPVFLANLVAFFTYKPRCYRGEITLLRATESEFPSQGWRHLADSGLVEHVLAGDHYSIFRPSQVGALAATLQGCLARALPPSTACPPSS